jgi:hypothetical protein
MLQGECHSALFLGLLTTNESVTNSMLRPFLCAAYFKRNSYMHAVCNYCSLHNEAQLRLASLWLQGVHDASAASAAADGLCYV